MEEESIDHILIIALRQEFYESYCLLFLELLGFFLFRLEIPFLVAVVLIWTRSVEMCGRQPLCVFFGRFGRKEI